MHWLAWDKLIRPKSKGGMGFKDMAIFNQALLAKQALRLVEKPDSLCARFIKAKYYPNGNLLDTAFIRSSSPVWQGIKHGLELLKSGYIWRLGNGKSVDIWIHNWLPRGNLRVSGKAAPTRIRRVSDLLMPGQREWNAQLINHIFYPHDAETILNLKLPASDGEDVIAWQGEKSGNFTVRSAYRLALDMTMPSTTGESSGSPQGDRKLNDVIWKANVPPKVRVFGWKLATNSLAVQVLRSWRIGKGRPTCSICGREEETNFHAVMNCTKARALRLRMRSDWKLPEEGALRQEGDDWVLVMLDSVDALTHQRLLLLWWRVWHLRNDSIFGTSMATIEESAQCIRSYSLALENMKGPESGIWSCLQRAVHDNRQNGMHMSSEPRAGWTPAAADWLKLNCDASFIPQTGESWWGSILRSSTGTIIASAWGISGQCVSVVEAEAIAARCGIEALCEDAGMKLHLESDCIDLISGPIGHLLCYLRYQRFAS